MSHHIDTPAAREDGRVDLCDLHVVDGADPATTFHPEVVYEFKIDTYEDDMEDLSYRFRFGEPDSSGEQPFTVLRAEGEEAQSGTDGEQLAQGRTNEQILLTKQGRVWQV